MPNIARAALVVLSLACFAPAHAVQPARVADRIGLPGAPLKSFDIGFAQRGIYALSDRSNAAVDLIDTHSHKLIARVGGFAGDKGDQAGPNGVVLVEQREVWAGDGNSQVRIIDLKSHRVAALVSTGGVKRVDEMAYDPRDHLIAAVNDADEPPFISLISSDPPYAVRSKIEMKRATSGVEQPVWDPQSGKIFVAIPELDGKPAKGGIAIIDPKQGKLVGMDGVSECMPAGLVLGPAPQMLVGCSNDAVHAGFAARSLLLDAKTGKVTKRFDRVGGSDEIWYDASTRRYALSAVANPGGPVIGFIDADRKRWLGNVPSAKAAHSVTSDAGEFFVPIPAGDKACPRGCVEVLAP
jgi:hypothetical protein